MWPIIVAMTEGLVPLLKSSLALAEVEVVVFVVFVVSWDVANWSLRWQKDPCRFWRPLWPWQRLRLLSLLSLSLLSSLFHEMWQTDHCDDRRTRGVSKGLIGLGRGWASPLLTLSSFSLSHEMGPIIVVMTEGLVVFRPLWPWQRLSLTNWLCSCCRIGGRRVAGQGGQFDHLQMRERFKVSRRSGGTKACTMVTQIQIIQRVQRMQIIQLIHD